MAVMAFLLGCFVSTTVVLNLLVNESPSSIDTADGFDGNLHSLSVHKTARRAVNFKYDPPQRVQSDSSPSLASASSQNPLDGIRILVAIVAFDFNQIPHLEEVLDAYQDLCVTGAAKVDIVIHSTVAYPVTLIDLLNSRLLPICRDIFSITIVLKPSQLRLHLVDCHRELFYDHIDEYDLFIYTEDDIRVTPKTVGAYLSETKKVQDLIGMDRSQDYNIGIVRYEYNYPNNVIIDDKTRHATQNVTRVYWEHGNYPIFPKAVDRINTPELQHDYCTMANSHQGMYLATRFLLKAWKDRPNCNFDVASNRPGMKNNPHQPSMGTQRVW